MSRFCKSCVLLRATLSVVTSVKLPIASIVHDCSRAGVPATAPIVTPSGRGILQDAINDLKANFSSEMEQDWATVALAYYLPPDRTWTNKFGERFSFDSQVERFTQSKIGEGSSCAGTHALMTLTVILGIDQQQRILSDQNRGRAHAFLRDAKNLLEENQKGTGAWDIDWANSTPLQDIPWEWSDTRELLVTGHILDWQSAVPSEFRLSDPCLKKGLRFVVMQLSKCDRKKFVSNICPYSHALRACGLLIR